jgi:hypothetical protein
MEEVRKQFRQPGPIDERRKRHFVEEVMPNVPTLTEEEDTMLESVAGLEEELYKKGKRVKGTLKEGIDKFLWREEDNVWAAFGVTVDKSAKGVLAEEFLLDTFESSEEHFKNNGNLPRVIRNDFKGMRSVHIHCGVKVPAATNRLFENWFVWKEVKLENGQTSYILAFMPLTEYPGGGFKDLSKDGFKLTETTGVYFFNEIAPNVCRVTRIQTVDLKFSGIHKTLKDKAIDYLAKKQLVQANTLQEKFRRNGKEVDAEVREALVERMKEGVELKEDQKKVFGEVEELFGGEEEDEKAKSLKRTSWKNRATFRASFKGRMSFGKLFGGEDKEGWGPLESPYEEVKMEIKYSQQMKGERSIALGRAYGKADCTAEEAAAWYFEYCGRERNTLGFQAGDLARLEVRKGVQRRNEKLIASVKKFPLLLNNREFVFRNLWKKNENDSISVGSWPSNDEIDYGGEIKNVVRAEGRGLLIATNISKEGGIAQCKLHFKQHLDAGGFIPLKLVEKKIPKQLQILHEIQETFKQDEEVDKAALENLAKIMRNEQQNYTEEEKLAIRKGKEFYEKCKEERNFDDLQTPDERVKVKLAHVDGASSGTALATTVVDASVEECAASEFAKLGNREHKRNAKNSGITDLNVVTVNPCTLFFIFTRDFGLPGFAPRDGRSKVTWFKQQDGKVIIDVADTDELQVDFPVKAGNVLAKAHTVWVFEPLDPIGGVLQTSVTLTTKMDLGGIFFSSIVNKIAPRSIFVVKVTDVCSTPPIGSSGSNTHTVCAFAKTFPAFTGKST